MITALGKCTCRYANGLAGVRSWVAGFMPQRSTLSTRDVLPNINQLIRTDVF